MSPRNTATKQMKQQVESILGQKGIDPTAEQQSMLDDKYADVDDWLDDRPEWMQDTKITATVTDVEE